jgi:hypothetical protein
MTDPMTSMYTAALAMVDRPVVTSHVYPPIPVRDFDWCAYFDDVGADCSPYGWGRTEAEAKQDLLDNYGEDE